MNILLFNGKIFTQDEKNPLANSLYIEGNKIKKVGNFAEIKTDIKPQTEKINLNGKVVLPGFIDTHTHFIKYALSKENIDFSNAKNLAEVEQKLIDYRKKNRSKSDWIIGFGWNKNLWNETKNFNKYFLDKIFPHNPVYLSSKDGHTFLCNSKALKIAGISKDTKSSEGCEIGFFKDGSPNGFLYENAWKLIHKVRKKLPFEKQKKLLKSAISEAHSLGLTGIHNMGNENADKLFSSLQNENELKLRICWHFPLELLDEMIENGVKSYSGDEWIKIGGVKLFIDGSIGSQSAYMFHQYTDSKNYGYLVRSEEGFYKIVEKATRSGIATSTHAIGDRGVNIVINSIEKVNKLLGEKLFHRIEHLQCVTSEDQKRVAKEGIYCAMQPIHISLDVKISEKYLGKYAKNSYPFRSLLNYGAKIGFGSDVPIENHNPFLGIYSALERKYQNNPDNQSWISEQKISVEEAIKSYTIFAALGSQSSDKIGSICSGKLADIIIIDDFTNEDNSFWLNAKPYVTIVDGEIVFSR